MTPQEWLQEVYEPLLDDDQTAPYELTHDEPPPPDLQTTRHHLRALYDGRADVRRILLLAGGVEAGVTSRDLVCRTPGYAGGAEAGSADRATQPGHSTRYRPMVFGCRDGCGSREVRVYYDERDIPTCPTHRAAMELVRP